jgi:regulator of sirC expression with transglutaminase-like and TPR domain
MNVDNHPFDAYVNRPETELRVARAALLFALDHDPRIPIEGCLRRLDQLAGRVEAFDADTPAEQVAALRTALVDEAGFRGRASDFCDPEASYLHAVLARRHGLPIALAVIWWTWPIRSDGTSSGWVCRDASWSRDRNAPANAN